MVRKISDNGGFYHEPPYTFEEEMELYRRMGGVVSTFRSGPRPAAAPPQKSPQQPPEE